MAKKDNKVVLAISLSAVSLAIAIFAGIATYKTNANCNDEKSFNTKVEKGITAFIEKQNAKQNAPAAPVDPIEVSYEGAPIKGEKNAPVTIVEFSEYECPYCGRYVNGAYKEIVEKYIETGKVKYAFRNFPLAFHKNAMPAATAALCARDQKGDDMYFNYHDKLFGNQKALDTATLKKYAKDLGLNESEFNTCLDSGKFDAQIAKDIAEAKEYGVRGTPAFYINGRMISGAQPFAAFEAIIEEELKK